MGNINIIVFFYNQNMRFITVSLLLSLALGGCGLLDPLNYEKETSAPAGTIEERHAWGQKHLGGSYRRAVNWVKNAEIVKEKVGNVTAVAPLGKPNYVVSYFTDGLQGYITLEVTGDKGKAVFSASAIAPCATGSTCFGHGTLTVSGEEIPIHHTGISIEKFNQPTNRIEYLTKKIKFYNRKLPPNTHPHESNPGAYSQWLERAEAYADNQEFAKAISDMETAISLWSKRHQKINKYSVKTLKGYLRKLAAYYYYSGQFNKSAEVIESVIEKNKFEEHYSYLDNNHLWLWLIRVRSGKQNFADNELKKALKNALESNKFCPINIVVTRFFVEELNEKDFFQSLDNTPLKYNPYCGFFRDVGFSYAYYYAGQKQIINGNIEKGKELLEKSLEYEGGYRLEREIANYELKKIIGTLAIRD